MPQHLPVFRFSFFLRSARLTHLLPPLLSPGLLSADCICPSTSLECVCVFLLLLLLRLSYLLAFWVIVVFCCSSCCGLSTPLDQLHHQPNQPTHPPIRRPLVCVAYKANFYEESEKAATYSEILSFFIIIILAAGKFNKSEMARGKANGKKKSRGRKFCGQVIKLHARSLGGV